MSYCKHIAIVLLPAFLFLWSEKPVFGQDAEGTMIYSVKLASNPAFTGSGINTGLKTVYRDYYPGQGFNLKAIYLGYDTYLEAVHGGMGFYINENILGGIFNDLRMGANYAYHLRASRDLYINAGFSSGLIHRSIKRAYLVFPDQIDPFAGNILPTEENLNMDSRAVVDIGVGFLFSYRNYNAGFSFSHIGKPDLVGQGKDADRIKRRFSFHADARFEKRDKNMAISPLMYLNYQGNFIYGAFGGEFLVNPLGLLVLTHFDNNSGLYSCQTGISISSGQLCISYSYMFSPMFSMKQIPLTQSNILSLSISFNNVEKTPDRKAINYPKL